MRAVLSFLLLTTFCLAAQLPGVPAAPQETRPLTALPSTAGGYPRLGMWWPNLWEQPAAAVARYDFVIFGPWDETARVQSVKALNPNLLALNATNACELGYDPDDPDANADVLAIPPEWFLTQVGSTLRQPVDASQTTLPVEAVSISDGATVYPLFVVSDTVLIEGESVLVLEVDETARELTVQRGFVRPAAAHAAGARVAAHITFWPNSWLLNLSTLSPTATVDPAFPDETWAAYNARRAAALLADPIWDGILLDRSDPNESWLLQNSTARTIDPDQSNTLLNDYSAFDAAWNAGLRNYQSALRQAIDPDKIIYANWGMPNYDLLNGNNFEGFPGEYTTDYSGAPWGTVVFGPWAGKGSYFEWLALAQQPNLTMIETYEDDSGPEPTSGGGYDNPCDDPGFTPNYRKMRFGLTTALLGDGYFSYEINTNGHGSLCLLWFDEYDNAGAGRAYLGMPLGPAERAITLNTPNAVQSGGFESPEELAQWGFWADVGNAAGLGLEADSPAVGVFSARAAISQTAGIDWQISLSYEPVEVISGSEYTLSFWAKADRARTITAWVQRPAEPWDAWVWYDHVSLSENWQFYELSAPASGNDPAAALMFGLGESAGIVWLDEVSLQAGSRAVWRRDFSGGLALVNATLLPQTVTLGGWYRRIAGSQDPLVNDGQRVAEITLPPHDGIILLSETHTLYLPWLAAHPVARTGKK